MFEAALVGSREIGFTILSMTLSLVAVFIPVLFMGGIVGRLFHEFAVTIGAAILVSGFVSLTLTPMLCSRFLKPHHEREAQPLLRGHRRRVQRDTRLLRAHAPTGDGPPSAGARLLRSDPPRHRPAVRRRAKRISAERGYVAAERLHRDRTRHLVRRDDASTRSSSRRSCRPIRTSKDSCRPIGASGRNPTINQGRFFMHLKDPSKRVARRRRSRPGAHAEALA